MNLSDMSLEQLAELLAGFPKFRAKQVQGWIAKGCTVEQMKNLPLDVRAALGQVPFGGAQILNIDDPFSKVIKYLNKLEDGNVVESVFMEYHHGNSLCISSQVGCAMGCDFCASTIGGVVRNLTAGEMFFQVAALNRRFGGKDRRGVTNIVVMGSGEPLLNYENLVRFIRMCKELLGISHRNISVSTCGILEGMQKLAGEELPCNLCLSLHAADDQTRERLMPIAQTATIKQLLGALDAYFRRTGRRTIIEYMLIDGVNSSQDDAQRLAKLLSGRPVHVNLIAYNQVREKPYRAPDAQQIDGFLNVLTQNNISATLRRELGEDIGAACGQLRRDYIENGMEQ